MGGALTEAFDADLARLRTLSAMQTKALRDESIDVHGARVAVGRDAQAVRGLAALPLAAVVVVVVRRRFR